MHSSLRKIHSYPTLRWVSIFLPIFFIVAVLIWFPSTISPKSTMESIPLTDSLFTEPDTFKLSNIETSKTSDNVRPTSVPFYRKDRPNIVRVYFSNHQLTFGSDSCTAVFAVERTISDTLNPEKSALLELLKGSSEAETSDGYTTNLNKGIALLSIIISNGIATANFNTTLQKDVNGNCRISAVRSQISKTLMQFPGIESVVLAVDGKPITGW